MQPEFFFSASYAEARATFLDACADTGVEVEHHVNPNRGRDGETLATDVVRIGPSSAGAVLITLSATHGVEGFCGSAVQTGTLLSGRWRELPPDTALLMIHAINPFGFSWLRRVNEDNVDLNRNHVDHQAPYPENPGYLALRDAICPSEWSDAARRSARGVLDDYAARHGTMALQAAISGGQYVDADGLFFGGHAPVWSNRVLREIVARHTAGALHVGLIDYHTGLGPYGYGEPISDHGVGETGHGRLLEWLGEEVTATDDGSSSSAPLTGVNATGVRAASPEASHTLVTLEYGTRPVDRVLDALRADCWLHNHGSLDGDQGRAIKSEIRDCFYGDEPDWKTAVWARASTIQTRMLEGLASLV